jgi:hypothetical protein
VSHPIRDPGVQDVIERRARQAEASSTTARQFVEFIYQDGAWKIGNISVTWPRKDK